MSVFDLGSSHEQVVFCNDPASGLRAIIAIYSTALGPALGGTRFYPYADEAAAYLRRRRLTRKPFARVYGRGGSGRSMTADTDDGRELFLAAAALIDVARD